MVIAVCQSTQQVETMICPLGNYKKNKEGA